jgi:hypothetical protein
VRVAFDPVVVDGRRAMISGSASAEMAITEVRVRLDGTAPQPERMASGTATWSATFEDLPDNRRYQPIARVEVGDGSGRAAVGPAFAVGHPTTTVSATFNEHILAGRIAVQRGPCTLGFGACDASFNSLFFRFGLSPFALHAADPSGPWYLDPEHVPGF